MLSRILNLLGILRRVCGHLCQCVRSNPFACLLLTATFLFLISAILIFNICLAKLFTVPGALMLNLALFWLLLRMLARVLIFPGSIFCWKRNTEASYRVEMSKQFAHHIEHLHAFLMQMDGRNGSMPIAPGVTMEGVMLGSTVVENLARNFRLQQRDQVRFTAEQGRVKLLVQGIENWLLEAKVRERGSKSRGGSELEVPLTDWMQKMARSIVPVPLNMALQTTELVTGAEASQCVDRLEQLLAIFDGLQCPKDNCCVNARRFLRVPTVGSLHQLRAELQVRYQGKHYWVRTSAGRKLDTMFISCQGETGGLDGEDEARNDTSVSASKEETPLTSASEPAFTGPTMIWCNPNAAYYETMVYDSQWLEFYTQQGWNLFLFNYSGYGRSTGHPTPHRMRMDGDAIVEFLRKRGVTTIGVHGRSVGGIVGCHLAANHPDVVKFMVADRTFQTLHGIAKYMVGGWASKALSFAAMWANNEESFAKASCYKVIIRDPKDSTVPELSSMCTAVAFQALQRVAPSDVFTVEDERLQQIADAWLFFDVLFSVYDRDDGPEGSRCSGCRSTPHAEAKRPARQPALGNTSPAESGSLETGEEDTQRLVAANRARTEARDCVISTQWLEENSDVVRTAMAQHVDLIRSALDVVGTQLNAAGTSLDEALGRGHAFDEPLFSLKCFLANLQVWGSIGSLREPLCPGVDKDIELFLMRRSEASDTAPELVCRLANISAALTPEKLSTYHRQLSRALVAQVRRDFRSRLSSIRRAIEPCVKDDNPVVSKLYSATLAHLREVESFISSIHRFFKCVDLACEDPASLAESGLSRGPSLRLSSGDGLTTGDSSEEGCDSAPLRPPRPTFDRALTGYGVWVDCGHNGVLCEGEIQHFALHLKAAGFGRYAGGSQSHEREGQVRH